LIVIQPMEDRNKLIVGGVYKLKWMDNPCRLISFNSFQVFYDEWRPHVNSWGFTSLKSKYYYSRTPAEFFMEGCKLLRTEPLTENEVKVHRPDLDMWIARSKNLWWPKHPYSSLIQCQEFLKKNSIAFSGESALDIPEIFLYPFGPKGGHKKGVRIGADNGRYFSGMELFFKAQKIQSEYIKSETPGIGIFRTGIEKGLPSFYIGHYYDLAGCIQYKKP
jgi:hypothetical protein